MNPEHTQKTDTKTLIEALRILARDIQSADGVANTAISEAADRLTELSHGLDVANNWIEHHQNHCDDLISENAALRDELNAQAVVNGKGGEREAKLLAENAALKQRILDDNKAYGCELRDPSGTIWDYAKRLREKNASLQEALAISDDYINQMLHGDIELTHGQLESWRSVIHTARKEAQP